MGHTMHEPSIWVYDKKDKSKFKGQIKYSPILYYDKIAILSACQYFYVYGITNLSYTKTELSLNTHTHTPWLSIW